MKLNDRQYRRIEKLLPKQRGNVKIDNIAIDRMQDAEDYALWIDAQNEFLKQQARQYRKSGVIGFSFGAVSFGIGTPLIVEGVRSDNRTMLWSGVGIAGIGVLVWTAGHFIFQWW